MAETPLNKIEKAIMTYLWDSIENHGGLKPGNQARRITRIYYEMNWDGYLDEHEFSLAINSLQLKEYIKIEEISWIGFVYIHPLKHA